jgi:enoyl-CoA hydratase
MALVDALSRLPGARRILPKTPMAGVYWSVRTNSFTRRLQRLDKGTIAAINGLAFSAGCLIAQGFDLRLMADDDALSIGFVETAMGFGVLSGAQRLARDLGQARALDVLLNARTFTPTQAAEMGLITRTVPPDRLLDEAIATARRLAQLSPAPVRMLKRAVYEDSTKPLRRSLLAERAEFVVTATQPSVGPRMDSFLAQIAGGELSNRELMDIWDNVRGEQAS